MPVVGDVLELKDFQTLANIEGDILNVYHFRVESIGSAIGLTLLGPHIVSWFYDAFLEVIRPLQSNQLEHVRLEINNLMAYETDFYVGSPAVATFGSEPSPFNSAQTAWSFQYVRTLRTTRNGSKRIAGVPESLVDNNMATATALSYINSAEGELGNVQTIDYPVGFTMTMQPVIIRRGTSLAVPPAVVNPVGEVLYRGVGSQNTRKQLIS